MNVEIIKSGIRRPAYNNLTWVFPVRIEGRADEVPWKVDDFDLSMWFKESLGRYPRHERGDSDTLSDVLENWDHFEPRLRLEAQRQAELGLKIEVEGVRISTPEWEAAREVPKLDLPPLNEAQREAAGKMKLSEEDYARGFLAGERSRALLLAKTERVARLLTEFLTQVAPSAVLRRVTLSTTDHRFDVDVADKGFSVPLRIREDVVDDFFEGGSSDAEKSILRIVATAMKYENHATQ